MDPKQDPIQPQQQPNQGYEAVPAQTTNGMAVAGLILSFIIPLVGLILSIIGLNKAKHYNGNGHGLSIAGIIISIVMMLFSLLFLIPLAIVTIASINEAAKEDRGTSKSADKKITKGNSTELGTVHTEESGTYSVKLPKDWKISQSEASRDTSAFPLPKTGDFVSSAYIYVDKLYPDETLDKFVANELENIKSYQGGTVTKEGSTKINGVTAYEIEAEEDTGSRISASYTVILVKGDVVYRLNYKTSPERAKDYLDLFKASAQTFTVK